MATTGTLSHIDVSAGYPERSIPFYHAFLTSLGFQRRQVPLPEWDGVRPQRATWTLECPGGSRFEIEVRPARMESRDRRYDRYEPGPHHLAFHAGSEVEVDGVYEAVRAAGGEVLDAPAEYGGLSGYGKRHYAAFFADPDGVKLEVCYVPAPNP